MDWGIGGVLIVSFGLIAAGLGLMLTRRFVAIPALDSHHEVAGFIFGTLGVIYAVVLAFVLVAFGMNSKRRKPPSRKKATILPTS